MNTKRCRVLASLILLFSFAIKMMPAHADTPPVVDLVGLANALQDAGMNPSDLAGSTPAEAFMQFTAAGIDPTQFGAPDPNSFSGTLPVDQTFAAIFAAKMTAFSAIAATNPEALSEQLSAAVNSGVFDSLGIDPSSINFDTIDSGSPEQVSAVFASILAARTASAAQIPGGTGGSLVNGFPAPPLPFGTPHEALQVLVDPAGDGLFSFEIGHLPGHDGTMVVFNPSEAILNAVYDTMSGVSAEVIASSSSRDGEVIVLSGAQEKGVMQDDLGYSSQLAKITKNEPVDRTAFPNFGNESLWW